jgi:hypothetical protein
MQRIVAEVTDSWEDRGDLYIGCSGNLTIERAIFTQGWRLHGNDVLLYSSAIGSYFAGTPLTYTLTPAAIEAYPWIVDYVETPTDQLATMMLLSRLVETLGKTNAYYRRIVEAHRQQWARMHEVTKRRIENLPMRLASFSPEDVFTWIDKVPKDAPLVMYPPFFGGDYTNQFAKLDKMYDWPARPGYEEIQSEHRDQLLEKIQDRKQWLMGVHTRLPHIDHLRRGMTQTTNRGVSIHVYSSDAPIRIVVPRQPTSPFLAPHLRKGQKLGEKMTLAVLSESQFSALRSKYMNPHIKPGAASLPIAVLVDGVLVGVFAFSFAPTTANWDSYIDGPHTYLLSDFPVANSSYKHLAKLVLYASLSHEAKALAERASNRLYRALTTTAFAKNPVSMKYRGVFKLLKRTENEAAHQGAIDSSDAYYAQRYELQYGQQLGQWSLDEGYQIWQDKSGVFNG